MQGAVESGGASAPRKSRAVGINHIALEVGDIDAALEFYGAFLDFEIAQRGDSAALVYFGDQYVNFSKGRSQQPDDRRHLGLVVDDREPARARLEQLGVAFISGDPFLDFLDPWGNRVELTDYAGIEYTKADHVLRGMGLGHLDKTDDALAELRRRGMAPS